MTSEFLGGISGERLDRIFVEKDRQLSALLVRTNPLNGKAKNFRKAFADSLGSEFILGFMGAGQDETTYNKSGYLVENIAAWKACFPIRNSEYWVGDAKGIDLSNRVVLSVANDFGLEDLEGRSFSKIARPQQGANSREFKHWVFNTQLSTFGQTDERPFLGLWLKNGLACVVHDPAHGSRGMYGGVRNFLWIEAPTDAELALHVFGREAFREKPELTDKMEEVLERILQSDKGEDVYRQVMNGHNIHSTNAGMIWDGGVMTGKDGFLDGRSLSEPRVHNDLQRILGGCPPQYEIVIRESLIFSQNHRANPRSGRADLNHFGSGNLDTSAKIIMEPLSLQ